jgi:pilus assembly protein Flp/PilA
MSKVLAYLNEQDGASAAEYALILAIVGAAIAAAAIFLGGAIASAMNSAATCIQTPSTTNC